ncbi:hypothetical protein PZA11_000086 [Diplocarpon coronariae]
MSVERLTTAGTATRSIVQLCRAQKKKKHGQPIWPGKKRGIKVRHPARHRHTPSTANRCECNSRPFLRAAYWLLSAKYDVKRMRDLL